MRCKHLPIASSLVVGMLLTLSGEAHAQKGDTSYSPPDILLLVDSSGSMGLTTFRENGQWALPKCGDTWIDNGAPHKPMPVNVEATALQTGEVTAPDRLSILIRVLTGSVTGMACVAQPRNGNLFWQEYALQQNHNTGSISSTGIRPVDTGYYLPYNRIVATATGKTSCTPAPSWAATIRTDLISNALSWPTSEGGPVIWREVGDFSPTPTLCGFAPQDQDGLLDEYADSARFGLMTFDTKPRWDDGATPRIGTGLEVGGTSASYTGGIQDTWSYFDGWLTNTTGAHTGNPGGCETSGTANLFEVGVRNPAAPPWEGRLLTFGDTGATTAEIVANNEKVQQALLALRPYGATPIAGMLDDARVFLLQDGAKSPPYVGPTNDKGFSTVVGQGCRRRAVILFTDGAPNADLRPDCSQTIGGVSGNCPYPTPAETAALLKASNINVYVIGMAVSDGAQKCGEMLQDANACNTLNACNSSCPANKCAYGYCVTDVQKEALAACCTISGIAKAGGDLDAYFVENVGEVRGAFATILKHIITDNSSRTTPVFATGSAIGSSTIKAANFFSSFESQSVKDLPAGTLTRKRTTCPATVPEPQPVLASQGDEFAFNVDSHRTSRLIYTVVGDKVDTRILSERSIRPWYSPNSTQDDQLGVYGVLSTSDAATKMVSGLSTVGGVISKVDPLAILGTSHTCTSGSCCFPVPSIPSPTAAQCRDRFLKLELGMSGDSDPSDPAHKNEVPYKRTGVFGAIMHSVPVLVPAPREPTGDVTYTSFQSQFASRPAVLYTATTDGQLHAFEVARQDSENNELWAFIPPAVLPMLPNQFPNRFYPAPQPILDGPVVVRDVAGKVFDGTGRFLSRTKADAANGANVRWYTILVGSFGDSSGYYALDVSWPNPNSQTNPPAGYTKGPRFLWQLTKDINGAPIFGERGGIPTIATLYFKSSGDDAAAEHAVAILPGGSGGQPATETIPIDFATSAVDSRVAVDPNTRRYDPSDTTNDGKRALGGARSLTVVRLDTGEVIRTFRLGKTGTIPQAADLLAPQGLYDSNRITSAPFDAPITGQLVAFPAGVGTVSDRAFIGDGEGHLWRIALSSADPSLWSASMFFDAFPTTGLSLDSRYTWQDRQPIQTPPVVSVDGFGRTTINFATGDQNNLQPSGRNIVWSITETIEDGMFKSKANWYLDESNAVKPTDTKRFGPGERVTGPLSLFNGILYFTTYKPRDPNNIQESTATTACKALPSYVWGVHYISAGKPDAIEGSKPTDSPADGPLPEFLREGSPTKVRVDRIDGDSIAFGVTVAQEATCSTAGTSSLTDPFLGFGGHQTMSSINPGRFQLMVQAGVKQNDSQTKLTTYNLPTPPGGALIDSWATIIE